MREVEVNERLIGFHDKSAELYKIKMKNWKFLIIKICSLDLHSKLELLQLLFKYEKISITHAMSDM